MTNAIIYAEPEKAKLRAAAFSSVLIAKTNLDYAWAAYSDALNRYVATGLEFGLRQASDVQEWALREFAEATAIHQGLSHERI